MSTAKDWVVCAPGDPNEVQTEAMIARAESDHYCATDYNTTTGAVIFTVYREVSTDHYIVNRDGSISDLPRGDNR